MNLIITVVITVVILLVLFFGWALWKSILEKNKEANNFAQEFTLMPSKTEVLMVLEDGKKLNEVTRKVIIQLAVKATSDYLNQFKILPLEGIIISNQDYSLEAIKHGLAVERFQVIKVDKPSSNWNTSLETMVKLKWIKPLESRETAKLPPNPID